MSQKMSSFVLLSVLATGVGAELRPISDEAMSEVTGQAFLSVDRDYHPDPSNTTSYTRINLGMEIDVQTNVDVLELGRYEREGERTGSSDVLIEDFALGYINNQAYFDKNPKAARQVKPDGNPYGEGEIVPFQIIDPFFEFAFDEASNEVVGVRLGFGEAMGVLSGSIQSLTGNVNIDIIDTGQGLREAENSTGGFFDQLVQLLTPVLAGGSPLITKAQLVQGPDAPNAGELDPIRAEFVGVPNGESFVLEDVNGAVAGIIDFISPTLSSELYTTNCSGFLFGSCDVVVVARDCEVLGIEACFSLDQYNSFPVGELESDGSGGRRIVAPKEGAFISFQTKDLEWLTDVKNTSATPEDFIRATSGAFFNIPNGAVEVNLAEALNGTARYRTEYIDRGKGLF